MPFQHVVIGSASSLMRPRIYLGVPYFTYYSLDINTKPTSPVKDMASNSLNLSLQLQI